MRKVINILKKVGATSSKNEKIAILEKHKDFKLLKDVLCWTYNPFKKYGITEKTFNIPPDRKSKIKNLHELIYLLENNNINNSLKQETVNFIYSIDDCEERELYKKILCKNLKIGLNSKTINKVFKGLIPMFGVQLAESYKNVKIKEGEHFWITQKLDGIRCICIYDNDRSIKFFTREGREILGLNQLKEDIERFIKINNISSGMVFDGELLKRVSKKMPSGDLYRETVKIVNSKSKDKIEVTFNMFDILTLEEFQGEASINTYRIRRNILDNFKNTKYVLIVKVLYNGTNQRDIERWLNYMNENEQEGVMINLDTPYFTKRHKGVIKVKSFNTADVKVIGFKEGSGKNKNKLGAFTVEFLYKEKKYTCDVGYGYTDKEREDFYINAYNLIGKIMEIEYFEISKNKEGQYSLRFPRFKGFRFDKSTMNTD